MVEIFLKLIDQLIEIVNIRQKQKKELFYEVVEPLFNQLQPIVDDYFSLFRQARSLIDDPKIPGEGAKELRKRREEMLRIRLQVRQLAVAIFENVSEKSIVEFAQNVDRFFFSTNLTLQTGSYGEYLIDLVDYIAYDTLSEKAKNLLNEGYTFETYVNEVLKKLEIQWIAISRSYAVARMRCLAK
jgi:hypothetical protein